MAAHRMGAWLLLLVAIQAATGFASTVGQGPKRLAGHGRMLRGAGSGARNLLQGGDAATDPDALSKSLGANPAMVRDIIATASDLSKLWARPSDGQAWLSLRLAMIIPGVSNLGVPSDQKSDALARIFVAAAATEPMAMGRALVAISNYTSFYQPETVPPVAESLAPAFALAAEFGVSRQLSEALGWAYYYAGELNFYNEQKNFRAILVDAMVLAAGTPEGLKGVTQATVERTCGGLSGNFGQAMWTFILQKAMEKGAPSCAGTYEALRAAKARGCDALRWANQFDESYLGGCRRTAAQINQLLLA